MRSQRIAIGDIVRIELDNDSHSYACVLPHASFAFYDYCGNEELPIEEIVRKPILFFAAVMARATKTGRWSKEGHCELDPHLAPPPKFIQDPLNPKSFSLYFNDGRIVPSSREECTGLERCSVWEPEHIEERIRDHFAGRENRWLKLQTIRE